MSETFSKLEMSCNVLQIFGEHDWDLQFSTQTAFAGYKNVAVIANMKFCLCTNIACRRKTAFCRTVPFPKPRLHAKQESLDGAAEGSGYMGSPISCADWARSWRRTAAFRYSPFETRSGAMQIRTPYLIFLGDVPDQLAAKTGPWHRGLAPLNGAWGQLRLPGCAAHLHIPDMNLRGKPWPKGAQEPCSWAWSMPAASCRVTGRRSSWRILKPGSTWRPDFTRGCRTARDCRSRRAPRTEALGCPPYQPAISDRQRRQAARNAAFNRGHRLLRRKKIHNAGA